MVALRAQYLAEGGAFVEQGVVGARVDEHGLIEMLEVILHVEFRFESADPEIRRSRDPQLKIHLQGIGAAVRWRWGARGQG
jgi:hypothetical protein